MTILDVFIRVSGPVKYVVTFCYLAWRLICLTKGYFIAQCTSILKAGDLSTFLKQAKKRNVLDGT